MKDYLVMVHGVLFKKAIDETESLLEDNDDSEKQEILNSTLKYLKSIRIS